MTKKRVYCWREGVVGLVVLVVLGVASGQDQPFRFPGTPPHGFLPNTFVNHNTQGFRQTPTPFQQVDSYLPRDLQTSELPIHLQHSLPQYHFTNNGAKPFEPSKIEYNFHTATPESYQNQQNTIVTNHFTNPVAPSTHRPNYSRLFSQNHHHNPQTETFLGQITIQSPADLPPEFAGHINPAWDEQLKKQDQKENGVLDNILNHRTRIFAPDNETKLHGRGQIKDYFVNSNGDVFITTRTPFVPKATPPPAVESTENSFVPSSKSSPVDVELSNKPKNPTSPRDTIDLEPLLEEPIRETDASDDHSDDVEVIKLAPEMPEANVLTTTTKQQPTEELREDEQEEYYDYDTTEIDTTEATEPPQIYENDYDETDKIESVEIDTEKSKTHANYEVLTMKPSSMVKDDNFKEFIDSSLIDSTTEEIPTTFASASSSKVNVPMPMSVNNSLVDGILLGGAVVSVVTTKSVVNNTVIASAATPIPAATTPSPSGNTTDTWVVVASVQTSRSVSGARYLPSPVVEQDERTKLLNEPFAEEENEEAEDVTTELPFIEDGKVNISSTPRTSTESLIDKLDRVQSDLSSGFLTGGFKDGNNIAVITEGMSDKIDEATSTSSSTTTTTTTTIRSTSLPPVVIKKFSPNARPSTTSRPKKTFETFKQDDITGLLPPGFKQRYPNNRKLPSVTTTTTTTSPSEVPQSDEPVKKESPKSLDDLLGKIKFEDVSALLPPGYKPPEEDKPTSTPTTIKTPKIVIQDDISAFLPPGYKNPESTKPKPTTDLLKNAKQDDISAFLPPGYKNSYKNRRITTTTTSTTTTAKPKGLLANAKPVDISAFLPPGYKNSGDNEEKPENVSSILAKAKPVEDISALLPPGYKPPKTTEKPKGVEGLLEEAQPVDISAFLPPGYKQGASTTEKPELSTKNSVVSTSATPKPSGGGFKVVFPSRPGSGTRKPLRLTPPKSATVETVSATAPTIHKGWPTRATTEFTGWPTPSTTPISIEKLLEAARTATSSSSTTSSSTSTTVTTTTTTTTTTTPKPTTPGVCSDECDLIGTIKLVGGAKWVPELLDRNTKEYQILANEVQSQLEDVFSRSDELSQWYKKIRIDGFSEGSVLVDYFIELNEVGRQINTLEIKRLFHESLEEAVAESSRAAKSTDFDKGINDGKLSLGNFLVDPKYTEFIVLPKQTQPTVGFADENVLLPQWAIAVIVIGLASLLFVIIFGVTVLVNRQKNAKKRQPTVLTEDMLNELNKNHMSGIDNYGADDLYNMEDVWNDKAYDTKLPKKRSAGSIHDNSMSNLYDSWRSEWNGYYYNAYYGSQTAGSSHYGGRRRSDYDTNF